MIETIIIIELVIFGLYILTQWKWGNKMISKYKYKIISKVIQNLVTWCSKNNDKKNQMICVYFQGVLNDYMKKNLTLDMFIAMKDKKNKPQAASSPQLESRIKKWLVNIHFYIRLTMAASCGLSLFYFYSHLIHLENRRISSGFFYHYFLNTT